MSATLARLPTPGSKAHDVFFFLFLVFASAMSSRIFRYIMLLRFGHGLIHLIGYILKFPMFQVCLLPIRGKYTSEVNLDKMSLPLLEDAKRETTIRIQGIYNCQNQSHDVYMCLLAICIPSLENYLLPRSVANF